MQDSFFFNKIISCLSDRGKRGFVLGQFYGSFFKLKECTIAPILLFFEAFEKVKPVLIVRMMRKGKGELQIPIPSNEYRLYKVGIKWIASAIKIYSTTPLSVNIASEIVKIVVEGNSQVLQRQKLLYAVAIENRALTHYRWTLD